MKELRAPAVGAMPPGGVPRAEREGAAETELRERVEQERLAYAQREGAAETELRERVERERLAYAQLEGAGETELRERVERERLAYAQLEVKLAARREEEAARLAAVGARSRSAAERLEAMRTAQASSLAQVAGLQAQLTQLERGLPRLRQLWIRYGVPTAASVGPLLNLGLILVAGALNVGVLSSLQLAGAALGLVVAIAVHREPSYD